MASESHSLKLENRTLEVSNLEKVYYPNSGFTKGEVLDYYIKAAPYLLPHLAKRPVTMKRYPDGVDGFFFYEKRAPSHKPEWVKTTEVPRDEGEEPIDYCLLDNLPSLIWAANIANLEVHTFLHRAPKIQRPTSMVFDLDPGAPANLVECCKVAVLLRKLLSASGLECMAKTSGSKGLQLYVPLNGSTTYEKTKPFSHAIAEAMERAQPDLVVSKMLKTLRKGKVLIDWSQNDDHKTTVCVYSMRATKEPSISMPLTWKEVEQAAKSGKIEKLFFSPRQALARMEKLGDLFAPVLEMKQTLPRLA